MTLGSLVSARIINKPKGTSAMVWQTNSQATSLATGKPVLPATVTESGVADSDF